MTCRRWLRLLFTREFPLRDAMVLWDGLFSFDIPFELVPWICVAMLIRIRNKRKLYSFDSLNHSLTEAQ